MEHNISNRIFHGASLFGFKQLPLGWSCVDVFSAPRHHVGYVNRTLERYRKILTEIDI